MEIESTTNVRHQTKRIVIRREKIPSLTSIHQCRNGLELEKHCRHPLEKRKLILHQSLRENRIWLLSRSSLKWFLANNGLW